MLHNLIAYGRYFRLRPAEVRQRAAELLEFVQLSERANEATEKLSGGMKRRLILARSLLNRPRLLILDEPTTGLDPQGRRLIWERIKALQQEGVTVVVTTHYMEEAEQLCDRILIMNQGRIIAEGSPRGLIEHHVGGEVLEVVPAEGEEEALLAALDGCGSYQRLGERFEVFTREGGQVLERLRSRVRLASYGIRRPNLEDVFLRLTGRDLHE